MKIALIGKLGEGEIVAGPERVARELFLQLKKNNSEIVFIEYYFSDYNNITFYKKLLGKQSYNTDSILRLGIIPLMWFLIRSRFDVIHFVNSQRFMLFIIISKLLIRSKFITTYHGFIKYEICGEKKLFNKNFLDLWVERLLTTVSDLLIFPSKLLSETFRTHYKINKKKMIVIPNGIGSKFCEQNNDVKFKDYHMKFVFYNGINDSIDRGLDKLLDLMRGLNFKIDIYVFGKKIFTNLSQNINLIFKESMSQDELINFMNDKFFVIKSTTYDSFSNIIIECMALGLIPIISDNVGTKDYINHEINGFIYSSSSTEDLKNLLIKIHDKRFNLINISFNAQKICKKLSWQNVSREYIAAFNSVL